MGYALHIERRGKDPGAEPVAIPLADWKAALSQTEGVRPLADREVRTTNPKTGQVISIGTRDGDAEVLWADDGQWRPAFSWGRGSVTFSGHLTPGDRAHPVWAAAVRLAASLGAVIRGDDGEVYDLETGEIVDA
jgi:hypothetical protein